jgi:putative DNA-invertase from lambdoid prophage Rac
MAVYGYVRVSTEEQVDGTSLEEQERRIRGAAMVAGLGDPEIFCDAGVSGSVPLDLRAAGGPMYERLKKGDTVIAAKLDRMFRNATDALVKSDEFAKRGVDVILVDIGNEPLQRGAQAQLYFHMLAVFANFERALIAERLSGGRMAKRAMADGLGFAGGQVPYGYRVEGQGRSAMLVPVPEEQEVIAKVYEALDSGMSMRAAAEYVNEILGVGLDWNAVRRLRDRRPKEEMRRGVK